MLNTAPMLETSSFLQLAHFLEADLQPWAAALAAALFPVMPEAQPSRQLEGGAAQAEEAAIKSRLASWQDAWSLLDELAPLGDAAVDVLRAWRQPLLEQLPMTPAEWQPAVIRSHATDGALQLDFATADACRGAMHAVHDVHTLSLTGPVCAEELPTATIQALVHTLRAVVTMPALRSLTLVAHVRTVPRGRCVESLADALGRVSQLETLHLQLPLGAAALAHVLGTLSTLTALDLGPQYPVAEWLAPALVMGRLSHLADLRLRSWCSTGLPTVMGQHLTALTTLTALNLSNDGLRAEALAPFLGRLSQLVELRLGENSINAETRIAMLVEPLKTLTKLTLLDFNDNALGDAGAAALAPALKPLSRLAYLRLPYNCIGTAGAAALAQSMPALSNLTALDLCENPIGDAGAAALAPALSRLSQLVELSIGSISMGAAGAAALAEPLKTLTTLTLLDLTNEESEDDAQLGASGAEALAPVLRHLSHLADLRLCDNGIGAGGAAALAMHLVAATKLTALYLASNEIGDAGAGSLVSALSSCAHLADLSLLSDSIGAAGAAVLAHPLRLLTALTGLELGCNPIGAVGVKALAPALGQLSRLATLSLRRTGIDDSAAAALAQHLGALTALTELGLGANAIGDAGAEALAPALSRLSCLQHLWLHDNALTDTGLRNLTPALATLESLSDLYLLQGNHFSVAAGAQFRASVPSCWCIP